MHLQTRARAMGAVSGTGIAGPLPSTGSPFPITIGPEQAVAHHGWAEARDRVLSAVLDGPSLVLVLGAPGTGKTLLLQELARTLRAAGTDVVLQSRGDLPIDAAEIGMAANSGVARRRVVLIDEADRMNEAALERLGRLGECAFVLAGMPDPGDDQPDGPSAAATTVVRLAALPRDEVGAFVAARLAESGLGADLLSSEAVARLAEHSGGMPRVLNMLAGAALFLARAERAPRVEAAHVDQAAALRDGDAGMDATGPAAPIVPGIVPCRQAESPLSPVVAPLASSLTAAALLPASLGRRQERRRHMAALGVIVGVAAACGGLAAWHGGHARRASPLIVAARPAPPPPGPVVPAPQPGASPVAPAAIAMAQAKVAAPPEPEIGAQAASPAPTPWAAPLLIAGAGVPSQPEALPSGAPAHVVVRYARGSADAAARAASLAHVLRAVDVAVDALIPVPRRDARPGARYFFAEDQGAAEAVLRAVGLPGKGSVASAAGLNIVPRPGLIELTVPPGEVEAGGRLEPPNPGRS